MKILQNISGLYKPLMTSNVQVTMKWKNEKDELGFWKGLMILAHLYLVFWLFYQWSYAQGAEAKTSQCKIVQGYVFDNALPAFRGEK